MPKMEVTLDGVGTNLDSYSFEVNIPSMNPSTESNSSGSISFSTGPLKQPQKLRNKPFTISDDRFGSLIGRVSEIAYGTGVTSFTAETIMQRLTATVALPPSYGMSTLACMNRALSVGGFTCIGLTDTGTDVFPGWYGPVLEYVRHFCVARNVEYSLNGSVLEFRPVRQNTSTGKLSALSFTMNDQTLAQNIDIKQYDYTSGENIEFYPVAAQDEPQVLTVDAEGTITYEIRINGWVDTINQPEVKFSVDPGTQDGTQGSYSVSGNDGLPVTESQWIETGGRLTVSRGDDPSIIIVKLRGPQNWTEAFGEDTLTPYSIAESAGDSTFYNSLHITGTGVRYAPTTRTFPTGATATTTIEERGTTVENPFVNTPSKAYELGVRAAQYFAGPNHSVSATAPVVDSYATELGARMTTTGDKFRITSLTVGPSGVSVNGEVDSLFVDFNELRSGETFSEFNEDWVGQTFGDFASLPLEVFDA